MEDIKRNNKKDILNSNKDVLNKKFIDYINALSDSIREYYKVSINIIYNKNILIKSLEDELIKRGQEKYISKEFKEIFNKLKMNINSDKTNLYNFLKDAKIIFKEMKEYQNSIKNNIIKKKNISYKNSKSNISSKFYSNSKMNSNIGINIKKFNLSKINQDISHPNYNKTEPQSVIKRRLKQILTENINTINNSVHLVNDSSKLLEEMEKLKKLNQNYEMNIRRLNMKLQEVKKNSLNKNNLEINNNKNALKIKDEIILNKNKVISSFKQDLGKSKKKSEQIFHNFIESQKIIKFLKKKNNKLYSSINSKINNNNFTHNINNNKFKNLIKRNKNLKSNFYNTQKNNLNYKIDSNYNNEILKDEIKSFENKNFSEF